MTFFGTIPFNGWFAKNKALFGLEQPMGFYGGGQSNTNIEASGGLISYANGMKIHTWYYNDLSDFQLLANPNNQDLNLLIVAGGGSGLTGTSRGGGAAAGRVYGGQLFFGNGFYNKYVGAGGICDITHIPPYSNGEDSFFDNIVMPGGGYSGRYPTNGPNGGSGAGAGNGSIGTGGLAVPGTTYAGLGNKGGDSIDFSSAAGGGGATQAGQDSGTDGTGIGGKGGEGYASNITGTLVVYGSGASGSGNLGSAEPGTNAGKGGIGNTVEATEPVQNTGSGGASAYDLGTGTSGANGIIVVAYPWVGNQENFGLICTQLN